MQSYSAKISHPSKNKAGFKSRPIRPQSFQLRLSTYPVWSMDPLGSRGWRGLFGGMSGQLRLALHPDQGTSALVKLPNKGGYIPAQVPGTLGICWPSPNKSPPLPARRASTGKGCTGRQTRRKRHLNPISPFQSQNCQMTGQHLLFQAHLLSVRPARLCHQSHTVNRAPTRAGHHQWCQIKSALPGGPSSLPEGSM